jgi:HEAT repeat protein
MVRRILWVSVLVTLIVSFCSAVVGQSQEGVEREIDRSLYWIMNSPGCCRQEIALLRRHKETAASRIRHLLSEGFYRKHRERLVYSLAALEYDIPLGALEYFARKGYNIVPLRKASASELAEVQQATASGNTGKIVALLKGSGPEVAKEVLEGVQNVSEELAEASMAEIKKPSTSPEGALFLGMLLRRAKAQMRTDFFEFWWSKFEDPGFENLILAAMSSNAPLAPRDEEVKLLLLTAKGDAQLLAVRLLGWINERCCLDALGLVLRPSLEFGELYKEILRSVGSHQDGVDLLIKYLKALEPDDFRASAALEALATIGTPAAMDYYKEWMTRPEASKDDVFRAAMGLRNFENKDGLPAVIRIAETTDDIVGSVALWAIRRVCSQNDISLVDLLSSKNPSIREEALYCAAKRKMREVVALGLHDSSDEVRTSAVYMSSKKQIAIPLSSLRPMLRDEEKGVRLAAIRSLAALRDPELPSCVINYCKDEEGYLHLPILLSQLLGGQSVDRDSLIQSIPGQSYLDRILNLSDELAAMRYAHSLHVLMSALSLATQQDKSERILERIESLTRRSAPEGCKDPADWWKNWLSEKADLLVWNEELCIFESAPGDVGVLDEMTGKPLTDREIEAKKHVRSVLSEVVKKLHEQTQKKGNDSNKENQKTQPSDQKQKKEEK